MSTRTGHLRLFEPQPAPLLEFEEDLPPDPVSEAQARSSLHGKEFDSEAADFLARAGGRVLKRNFKVFGFPMDFLIEGTNGRRFYVDGHGTPDQTVRSQSGMRRTDTMLKFGFKVLRLRDRHCPIPVVLLTSHMPADGSTAAFYLAELSDALWDAIQVKGDLAGFRRLSTYLTETVPSQVPIDSPWRGAEQTLELEDKEPGVGEDA